MASRLPNDAKQSRVVAPSGTVAQRKIAAWEAMGRVVSRSSITGRLVARAAASRVPSKALTERSSRSSRTK